MGKTNPELKEIIPGVRRIKVMIPDNPLSYVNTYLVGKGKGCALIDPGYYTKESWAALERQLAEADVAMEDITTLIVTHSHPDHIGLAGRIRSLSGAKILMHPLDDHLFSKMFTESRMRSTEKGNWTVHHGFPPNFETKLNNPAFIFDLSWEVGPDKTVDDGDVIDVQGIKLQVLWTPGHSPGHICLYQPELKALFTGDHVLPNVTPHIGFFSSEQGNPLSIFFNSLDKLNKLDVKIVFPGHGEYFPDLKKRIAELRKHHDQRLAEIMQALKDGEKSSYQVTMSLTWSGLEGKITGDKLPVDQVPIAMGETLAHLDLLVREKKISAKTQDDVYLFSIVDKN